MTINVLGSGGGLAVPQEWLHLDDPRIGVSYGATGNQAAKVQAALDMAAASGGGTVFVGGHVRCGNTQLNWPSSGEAVHLIGMGRGDQYSQAPSALWWDVDTAGSAPLAGDGANTVFAIKVPTNALEWNIESLTLQGPADGSAVIGDMPAKMYGVYGSNRGSMKNVKVTGFGAAVGIINDHQLYDDCDFRGNGYGLDFMDNSAGGLGDMLFRRCFLIDQKRASIAISDSNAIANTRFEGNGHCGAAPFGIYRYAGQQPPRTQAMQGVVFECWSFEYCGNAMIYDEAGGAAWVNVVFDPPAEIGTGGSAHWPGKPWPMAKVQIDYGDGLHWSHGPAVPQSDAPDQPLISAQDLVNFQIDDPRPLFDAITGSQHKSFVRRTGGIGAKYSGGRIGVPGDAPGRLVLGAMEASEAIARGSLVEMVGTSQVRESRNTTSSQILGVSLIDYSTGDVCVFASAGARQGLVVRNESGSTVANGALMTPDAAHQGCVKSAASLSDLIIGRAHDGAIASGATGPIMIVC